MTSLDREMRQILARMELLPHGSTQNYEPATASGNQSYGRPPGDSTAPHEYWRERWERAVWDDEEYTIEAMLTGCMEVVRHRRNVIRKAQADLDGYLKRAESLVVGETEQELEARIVREGEGWSVEQVAQHCRCTPTFARKARLKASVSTQTGKAPDGVSIDTEDQRQKAREYAENGYTERQIAMLTKLSKSTIRRVLGRVA